MTPVTWLTWLPGCTLQIPALLVDLFLFNVLLGTCFCMTLHGLEPMDEVTVSKS